MSTIQPINIDNIILKLLKGFQENERKMKIQPNFVYKKVDNVELTKEEMSALCYKAREIFLGQPVLLEVEPPIKVVGDIHGQYYDLLQILKRGGFPPESNYLFLGDYVDRGRQSLETISLLLAYKIKYPENFFLLRGNHECTSITRIYGFFEECKKRYSIKLWKTFIDVFNCLPVAAIIDDKIFCCHGGISPELRTMDQIRRIRRPTDVPDQGLLCDLLWSDPEKDFEGWGSNERGVSYVFGADVVTRFLQRNSFDLICRAHQVVEDGYEFFADRQLVTVFSAPNYCGEFDNAAAMMIVDEDLTCGFEIFKPKIMEKGNMILSSKENLTENDNNENEDKKNKETKKDDDTKTQKDKKKEKKKLEDKKNKEKKKNDNDKKSKKKKKNHKEDNDENKPDSTTDNNQEQNENQNVIDSDNEENCSQIDAEEKPSLLSRFKSFTGNSKSSDDISNNTNPKTEGDVEEENTKKNKKEKKNEERKEKKSKNEKHKKEKNNKENEIEEDTKNKEKNNKLENDNSGEESNDEKKDGTLKKSFFKKFRRNSSLSSPRPSRRKDQIETTTSTEITTTTTTTTAGTTAPEEIDENFSIEE